MDLKDKLILKLTIELQSLKALMVAKGYINSEDLEIMQKIVSQDFKKYQKQFERVNINS